MLNFHLYLHPAPAGSGLTDFSTKTSLNFWTDGRKTTTMMMASKSKKFRFDSFATEFASSNNDENGMKQELTDIGDNDSGIGKLIFSILIGKEVRKAK